MTNTVTINGHTYTDDGNASTGLANGGHRSRLIPLVADVVVTAAGVATNAGIATTKAGESAASAAAALASQNSSAAQAAAASSSAAAAAASAAVINLTAPGPIGGTTPAAGAFTSLSSTGASLQVPFVPVGDFGGALTFFGVVATNKQATLHGGWIALRDVSSGAMTLADMSDLGADFQCYGTFFYFV